METTEAAGLLPELDLPSTNQELRDMKPLVSCMQVIPGDIYIYIPVYIYIKEVPHIYIYI